MIGFVFFGYSAPMSILFGGIAAVGGGWIIAWWRSKEETKTQLSVEILEEVKSNSLTREVRNSKKENLPAVSVALWNFQFSLLGKVMIGKWGQLIVQ